MNAPLIWREWREMSSTVWWWTAGTVFLSVLFRFVDNVIGVAVLGAMLAMVLGAAATLGDRSVRVREFLLTRPVRRGRVLGAKLIATAAVLNGTMLLLTACALLDLPARFYGLFAETGITYRIVFTDSPVWYPAAFAFANALLLLVLVTRILTTNRSIGVVMSIVLCIATGFGVGRSLVAWPQGFLALAGLFFLVFLVASLVLAAALARGFRDLEVTGGAA